MIKISFQHSMPGLKQFFKKTACCRYGGILCRGAVGLAVLSLAILLASTGWAQPFIFGEVISVAPDRSGFTLLLDQNLGGEASADAVASSDRRSVRIVAAGEQLYWPECVQVGERVRVWGDFADGDDAVFRAEQIRGTGWGRDKSGVRSRLNRGGQSRQPGMEPGTGPGMGPGMGPGGRGR